MTVCIHVSIIFGLEFTCGAPFGKITVKHRVARHAHRPVDVDRNPRVRQRLPTAAVPTQEFVRSQRRDHRRSLGHAITQRQGKLRLRRRLGQRRPDRPATDKNHPKRPQPRHRGRPSQQPLQLGRHQREHPIAGLPVEHGHFAQLQLFPFPRDIATLRRGTSHAGHQPAHMVGWQHPDRIHPLEAEVCAKSPYSRRQGDLVMPSKAAPPARPSRRQSQPTVALARTC